MVAYYGDHFYAAYWGSIQTYAPIIETLLTAGTLLDEESTSLLTQKDSSLLELACAHTPANLTFLSQLTREQKFDPELLRQVRKRCTAIQHAHMASLLGDNSTQPPSKTLE
jgi:hypothetical protein